MTIPNAGHMAPVTEPARVAPFILAQLGERASEPIAVGLEATKKALWDR